MNRDLVVSIVITNYNYGRFLREAIESALQQTYPTVEVIVVDDGSTDNSCEIIASYADKIIPVLKENGGQGSAFNAGFAQSQGDVIIFLDAGDLLLPDIVHKVVQVFRANPAVVKVQYRMELIDAQGARTGFFMPPMHRQMLSGNLQAQVLQFADDVAWSSTSGNAFAAKVLHTISPIPEKGYGRVGQDLYLYNVTPLFGPVVSLDEVGAYYQVHGSNTHYVSQLDLHQTRQIILRTYRTHIYIKKFADILGLSGAADRPEMY